MSRNLCVKKNTSYKILYRLLDGVFFKVFAVAHAYCIFLKVQVGLQIKALKNSVKPNEKRRKAKIK